MSPARSASPGAAGSRPRSRPPRARSGRRTSAAFTGRSYPTPGGPASSSGRRSIRHLPPTTGRPATVPSPHGNQPRSPSPLPTHALSAPRPPPAADAIPQYSLRKILGVWASAMIPMGLLAWIVAPWLAGQLDGPNALTRSLIVCLTAGLVWQFVLVLILLVPERRSPNWPGYRKALWLNGRAPASASGCWCRCWPSRSASRSSSPRSTMPRPASSARSSTRTPVMCSCPAPGAGWPCSRRCSSSTPCWVRSSCSAGCCCRA